MTPHNWWTGTSASADLLSVPPRWQQKHHIFLLCGIMSQKTIILISAAMRQNSNSLYWLNNVDYLHILTLLSASSSSSSSSLPLRCGGLFYVWFPSYILLQWVCCRFYLPLFCTVYLCWVCQKYLTVFVKAKWKSIINAGYIPCPWEFMLIIEALRYKPEGHGFNCQWCHWKISLT